MRFCLLAALAILLIAPAPAGAIGFTFVKAGPSVLSNPHDVELSPDGTLLYVSDLGNDRIAVLDAETLALVATFGEADGLSQPHDIHRGPDGLLYVADTGQSRIVIYRPDGKSAAKTGTLTGRIRRPEGVLALENGLVFATGAASGNIVAFQDGKVIREAGGLRSPHDIALTKDGKLWVADAANDRMLLMTQDLKIERELKGKPYNFNGPRYQDLTEDGLLVIADKYTHKIKVVAPDGTLVTTLGTDTPGKGPGTFRTPEGVVIRGNDVWFADSGNDRVVRYRITR